MKRMQIWLFLCFLTTCGTIWSTPMPCCATQIIQNINNSTNNIETILDEVLVTLTSLSDELSDNCDMNVIEIHQSDIPYFITQPGKYCLTEDVSITTGDAISIVLTPLIGESVVIDLNGYTISGLSGGVPAGSHGITLIPTMFTLPFPLAVEIKNGKISYMVEQGINIPFGVTQLEIDSIVTEQCGVGGISFNLGGIAIGGSGGTINPIITNCRTYGLPGHTGFGISLYNCSQYRVSNCIANGNGMAGIFVTGDSIFNEGVIDNCIASGNTTEGFSIQANEQGVVLQNCVADSNGSAGFLIYANGSTLINCVSTSSTLDGMQLNGDNNEIINSASMNNGSSGFFILGNQSIVKQCAAIDNQQNGFSILGNNNQINNNNATGNNPAGGAFYGFNNTGSGNRVYGNFANNNNAGANNYSPSITNVATGPTATTPVDLNFTANISE